MDRSEKLRYMRVRILFPLVAVLTTIAPAAASASFAHVVSPGESLSSIAAADGLTVDQLAAANGVSADAKLIAGGTVQIPPQTGGVVAGGTSTTADGGVPASSAAGSYVVAPGDTLSAIAARAGVSVSSLAAANGIDPGGVLVSGTTLQLSGAAPPTSAASAANSQAVGGDAGGTPSAPPSPTGEQVTASQIAQVAAASGVSPSLADAIAWQESGFNNGLVSSADARGVMQILPGTWDWIRQNLIPGSPPLAGASAIDNVRGGVAMLRSLLSSTGGDPALAAAAYYQGLGSVQRYGVLPSTQQYVNNVLALARRFGGG